MTGAREFSEVFLDGVRAPLANVIGGLNNGWHGVQTTLQFERVSGGRGTVVMRLAREREYWALVDEARNRGRSGDPIVRQGLAWAYTQIEILRWTWNELLPTYVQDAVSENKRQPGNFNGPNTIGALGSLRLKCWDRQDCFAPLTVKGAPSTGTIFS